MLLKTNNHHQPGKKRNFSEWWKRFVKRGQEHLTIMLVPHNEQAIINFQISWFAIWFILALIAAIIIAAVIVISGFQINSRQLSSMRLSQRDMRISMRIFQKDIKRQQQLVQEIKNEITSMATNMGMIEAEMMWSLGGPEGEEIVRVSENELGEEVDDPSEVTIMQEAESLSRANQDLELMLVFVHQLRERVAFNNQLFYDIPSIWPVTAGGHITSVYGVRPDPFRPSRQEFHKGLDIAAFTGTPVIATADGVVSYSGYHGGFGNEVIISHKYGFSTVYAHLLRRKVFAGQKVKRGTVIGTIGSSGRSTGPHLHYEVRIGSQPVDPEKFIFQATSEGKPYIPQILN